MVLKLRSLVAVIQEEYLKWWAICRYSDKCQHAVAEQLHCSLHVKELKVTKVELKRQIGG